MWKLRNAVALGTLMLSSCYADVGSNLRVPDDAAITCEEQCRQIGMELSAVAIMANTVGCVCQHAQSSPKASRHQEAITAGMATIVVQEAARQQQQQHQHVAPAPGP